MTRVLQVTRDFPPRTTGGISTAVGGMVRALVDAGLDVAVASFDGWRPRASRTANAPLPVPDDVGGVPVLRLSAPDQLPAFDAFCRDVAPDVVHVHHEMLWPMAADRAPRAVYTAHVVQAEQNRLRGVDAETHSLAAQRRALAEADRVIAPSAAAAALIGGASDRVRVVGIGIDVTAPMRAAAARPRTSRTIAFAGRFADINGTAELLAAVPDVLARVPGARAIVAGGLPENPRADARWRRRWREDVPDAVRARIDLPGWLDANALAEVYAAAEVMLVPSWFETFGLTTLEAMAWGAPVVASAGELVVDGHTGVRVPPRDPAALADAVVALLADPARGRRLAAAAAQVAHRDHAWAAVAPGVVAAYTDPLP